MCALQPQLGRSKQDRRFQGAHYSECIDVDHANADRKKPMNHRKSKIADSDASAVNP
jgi:hypothetical protein